MTLNSLDQLMKMYSLIFMPKTFLRHDLGALIRNNLPYNFGGFTRMNRFESHRNTTLKDV